MSNVIGFPSKASRITPEEVLKDLTAAVESGEIDHLLVVTMSKDTAVNVGMSTSPAHCMVYMNNFQRMKIEELMRNAGMI